jgi:hypothetical protein
MKTKLLLALCLVGIFKTFAQGPIKENRTVTTKEQIAKKPVDSTFEFIVDQNNINNTTKGILNKNKIKALVKTSVKSNINVFRALLSDKSVDTTKVDSLSTPSPITTADVEILKNDTGVYIVNTRLFNYYRSERKKIRRELDSIKGLTKLSVNNNISAQLTFDKDIQEHINRLIVYDTLFDKLREKLRKETKSPNNFTSWFPSSDRNKKYIFFSNMYSKEATKDLYVGNSASLEFGKDVTAAGTELVATYFGPFRTAFGTLITNSGEDDATSKVEEDGQSDFDEALQRLKANGGNLYLTIDYPVYCSQTKYATAYGNLYGKGGMVFSQISNDVDTSSGNGSVGGNGYASVASDDKAFILYVNCNFGYYFGSKEFYQNLKLSHEKGFAFGQITFGINVSESLRFTYTPWTFGSDESIRTERGTVGIQILSGLFKI